MVGVEVRHPDRADPGDGVQLLHRPPGFGRGALPGPWPVDEVQVEYVEAEPIHAGVEGTERRVVPLVGVPALGGDDPRVALEPGLTAARADSRLVVVQLRGVDVPV